MKRLLIAIVVAGTALGAASAADARQGCGRGFHRAAFGRCVRNRIGGYYHGLGWWDGRRYWQHRYHAHGGWRYR